MYRLIAFWFSFFVYFAAEKSFDEKMILLLDYFSWNAINEKEISEGKYVKMEKAYRGAMANKYKLQKELTELRLSLLIIKRFIDG